MMRRQLLLLSAYSNGKACARCHHARVFKSDNSALFLLGLYHTNHICSSQILHPKRYYSNSNNHDANSGDIKRISDLLFSRPLAERVAALHIAETLINNSKNNNNNNNKAIHSVLLSDFMKSLPSMVNDYLFSRGVTVRHWITSEAQLFQLTENECNDGLERVELCIRKNDTVSPLDAQLLSRIAKGEVDCEEGNEERSTEKDSNRNDDIKESAAIALTSSDKIDCCDALEKELRENSALLLQIVDLISETIDNLSIKIYNEEKQEELNSNNNNNNSNNACSKEGNNLKFRYHLSEVVYREFMNRCSHYPESSIIKKVVAKQLEFSLFLWIVYQHRIPTDNFHNTHSKKSFWVLDKEAEVLSNHLFNASNETEEKLVSRNILFIANVIPQIDISSSGATSPLFLSPIRVVKSANKYNNYADFQSLSSVPTKKDIFEVLKYVPVNFGRFNDLQIPTEVIKKHIRLPSFSPGSSSDPNNNKNNSGSTKINHGQYLLWFRRQPYHFELRNIAGTIEIRRSPFLHPLSHFATEHANSNNANDNSNNNNADEDRYKEALQLARHYVEKRIALGSMNSLERIEDDNMKRIIFNNHSTAGSSSGVYNGDDDSADDRNSTNKIKSCFSLVEKQIYKIMLRVIPGYFIPISLVIQRTNKTTHLNEKLYENLAKLLPEEFELFYMSDTLKKFTTNNSKSNNYCFPPLIRRRTGADSSRWINDFVSDLLGIGNGDNNNSNNSNNDINCEEIKGVYCLLNYMCATFDRTEYIYVRLSDEEKLLVGGFTNLEENLIKRHPKVFIFDEKNRLVMRNDLSDPTQMKIAPNADKSSNKKSDEADKNTILLSGLSRTNLRDENPYLSPTEIARVYHYLLTSASAGDYNNNNNKLFSVDTSYFVDRSSPAITVCLPPRIISIFTLFPHLFSIRENSPGNYEIMAKSHNTSNAKNTNKMQNSNDDDNGRNSNNNASDVVEDNSWLDEDTPDSNNTLSSLPSDNNSSLSREEILNEILLLLPNNSNENNNNNNNNNVGIKESHLLQWTSTHLQSEAQKYGGLMKICQYYSNQNNKDVIEISEGEEGEMIIRRAQGNKNKEN